ncbi:MAG TPA: RDD family protein [Thermoanaerobaculia bacterium]|nr:RDD family protein [Thermoanaerobaculia bacterium]
MIERAERVILTPEHVPIRLTPAGLGSRFIAVLIDFFLAIAVIALLARLFETLLPLGLARAVLTTCSFIVLTGYHIWFEVRHQGRTLGKRMAGLRVVDGRGLPITLEQSFVRNIVRVLDFAPVFYGVGGLVSLIDRDNRRLGDILADTLVVQERTPLVPQGDLRLDRRYNTLSAPALRRRIRQRVSLEEREFLLTLCLRADRLTESARYDLMEKVGDHYRKRLDIFDPHLSNENLVRDLTAMLYGGESPPMPQTIPTAPNTA